MSRLLVSSLFLLFASSVEAVTSTVSSCVSEPTYVAKFFQDPDYEATVQNVFEEDIDSCIDITFSNARSFLLGTAMTCEVYNNFGCVGTVEAISQDVSDFPDVPNPGVVRSFTCTGERAGFCPCTPSPAREFSVELYSDPNYSGSTRGFSGAGLFGICIAVTDGASSVKIGLANYCIGYLSTDCGILNPNAETELVLNFDTPNTVIDINSFICYGPLVPYDAVVCPTSSSSSSVTTTSTSTSSSSTSSSVTTTSTETSSSSTSSSVTTTSTSQQTTTTTPATESTSISTEEPEESETGIATTTSPSMSSLVATSSESVSAPRPLATLYFELAF